MKACPPDSWWVKIADFGISKRIEGDSEKSTTLKGTFGYIAPEIHGFTPRGSLYSVDIWAAGEILFQILTKRHTFDNLGLLANYIRTPNNFPSHQLLATNVSQLGVEFVRCLMSPTPTGRISAKDALESTDGLDSYCHTILISLHLYIKRHVRDQWLTQHVRNSHHGNTAKDPSGLAALDKVLNKVVANTDPQNLPILEDSFQE